VDKDLKSKTFAELERLVVELGQKKYIAGYIFGFIHKRGVNDISAITPLNKSFRNRLVEEGRYISKLEVIDKLTDPDGTVKYVFGLADGGRVEAVLLFDNDRRTLCVSTQVGCAMGCVFCATGRLGLARNLTTAEIVDQVNLVTRDSAPVTRFHRATSDGSRVTNVVFMGMGEPLANYDCVLAAVRILNHPKGQTIGIRHLTISTCGLPEEIERLADEDILLRLAISLNAPTDAIRQKLMPIAKKYSLDRLFSAIELYQRKTHNRVTFEYCLIKGVNDNVLHARMLVRRLRPFLCNVNLIELNPISGRRMADSVWSSDHCTLHAERCFKPSGPEATRLGGGSSVAKEGLETPSRSRTRLGGGSSVAKEGLETPSRSRTRLGGGSSVAKEGLETPSRSRTERFAKVLREAGVETTIRQKMGQTINAACGQLGESLLVSAKRRAVAGKVKS
jgi:23S rRNA (adenine2503-C2)-methyltransferase